MATQTVEKELRELEQQYWQALKDNDIDEVIGLTDDPCIVTGAQGVARIDHGAYRAMMANAQWSIEDYDVSDVDVRILTDDVAVVAYKVREELTVEGKPVTLEAADASTWVRRDGRWLCALHTESIIGDPFGRDRRTRQHVE